MNQCVNPFACGRIIYFGIQVAARKLYLDLTWQPLGPLLKVKPLAGWMQNPTKLKGAKGMRLI